jgi:MFS family permease
VLADSSIVTLALPEVLRDFGTSVFGVSWVLTAFNVVLAAAVVPAARALRGRDPRAAWAAGLVVFAGASLACALSSSIAVLIVARCVQALGGAAIVAAVIELLARTRGSHRRAAPVWGTASVAGLAIGPALGGLLTDLLSWQAIFAVQVPIVLCLPAALAPVPRNAEVGSEGTIEPEPEIALALLSAALTGALFLLVVMLIEGWNHSPLEAAAVVSVIPVAAMAARTLAPRVRAPAVLPASGAVAVAGGLAALGLLPSAGAGWTIAPQLMIGAGLAITIPALTERALRGPDPRGRRAVGTIAARHAGIVAGILVLTPIFSAQLDSQHAAAERSGTALILDASLAPQTKVRLAEAIGARIDRAGGRLPDLSPAFREVQPQPGSEHAYAQLERSIGDEIDKAATHAFSTSFLVAAALALLSLVPIARIGLR